MTNYDHEAAVNYALRRLESELPARLTYHNLFHTRDDVIPAAMRLAEELELAAGQIELVQVAAAFHDIGFIVTCTNHEAASIKIAEQILPEFGFEDAKIKAVCGMILATRLPQSPANLVEKIIADSDLDVLGRADFFERSLHLHQEISALGNDIPIEAWYQDQLQFLEKHRYFTQAARIHNSARKQQNVVELRQRLELSGIARWQQNRP